MTMMFLAKEKATLFEGIIESQTKKQWNSVAS